MPILFFFAFLSGFVTILAPCIWPILPIILAGTTTGGNRKPLGITLGVTISFGVLTLALSYIVKILPIDPNALRYFAAAVILFLGLSLTIPKLSEILEGAVSSLSGKLNFGTNNKKNTGFLSGFIMGLALGVVWAPCAGPIFATVATLAATQKVNIDVIFTTLFYVLGIGIPLFIFATLGRRLFTKTRALSAHIGKIQKVFGVIMVLTAFLIISNYDKAIETGLLNVFPFFANSLNAFESTPIVSNQLNELKGSTSLFDSTNNAGMLNANYPAPDFVGITHWLNTNGKSISVSQLKGKVVLVDFWTYTCINCIRTLPHITSWYNKYRDKGFVVVGIHTPEFQFEHDTGNVENALKQYGIFYPVGQDNNYATWNNYNNQYWPAEYLIDSKGVVRRTHFGEGEYGQMEEAIQKLLDQNGKNANIPLDNIKNQTPTGSISPETYLGSSRMQYLYPGGAVGNGTQNFTLEGNLPTDSFSYGGTWNIENEDAVSGKNAQILYNFNAGKVYIILAPPGNGTSTVRVYLDGNIIDSGVSGADVKNGTVTVTLDRLYNIVDFHGKTEQHTVKLEFLTPGTHAYTFTFG